MHKCTKFLARKEFIGQNTGVKCYVMLCLCSINYYNKGLEAMQDNFLTKISHEVRTPINAIIGLGYLFQQTRLEDQQRVYLDKIIDSAKGLLSIFQEMLDYSIMEEEGLSITLLPFSMQTVLGNVAATIIPRCEKKGIAFDYAIDPELPFYLEGDAIRIMQALINLADNAVKFTEEGLVSIIVEKASDNLVIFHVSDSGIGIAKEHYQDIFKPFYQVDNSHTRQYGGAGLGLATCAKLVEVMNGSIEISPNADGGTTFSLALPLPEAEEIHVEECVLTDRKVLVVDGDPLTEQITTASLLGYGMRVEQAYSGEEGLEMIASADNNAVPYDFVLISWRMADMDGIETAQQLARMETQHVKPRLVLHSSHDLKGVEGLAREAGFVGFLAKPTTPKEALKVLSALLEVSECKKTVAQNDVEIVEGPVRILLVEDNEINQEIASEVLKAAEYDVDIANNGQEAVDMVAKTKYSLLLMDVQMPVMDGLEATRNIRAAGYRMPIIAMTAHASEEDKDASMQVGMNAHLTKPLEPMGLFATLNSWLPAASMSKKEAPAKVTKVAQRVKKLPDALEGFNLSGGLATVGGNESLYISLLLKFADRYATINDDITESLKKNDLESAIRHAHTVRGIAANLGAEALATAAETLEKSFVNSPSMVTPHLRTLVLRLGETVAAIREEFGTTDEDSSTEHEFTIAERLNAAEREHASHVLYQAVASMDLDWGHAVKSIKFLLDRLHGTKAESLLKKLEQAVEDFELEEAQKLCWDVVELIKEAN